MAQQVKNLPAVLETIGDAGLIPQRGGTTESPSTQNFLIIIFSK